MKPEEYPRKTSCKYTNVVTGVLEYFERMNTRSGSLKKLLFVVCLFWQFFLNKPRRSLPNIRMARQLQGIPSPFRNYLYPRAREAVCLDASAERGGLLMLS